ncbi:hypothetical protein CSB93_2211 [Pseudomonas paraeruginosa]|uniref:Uncharacterized protein n=1 Tax=Pseudomonas paraeruginosa TaxID=2994495 RepID=A0A2R3ITG4_9PSED|nr:hypothetical protein CSB93_2211 [Pseudomonas paraeruginosa]AWE91721.1 hypothetical protein CSC28_0978 [Pseudomonas paraeruginosa]PTC38831.1 hypothetical protein CLJ1_0803 [Pseudomonas aeruginosa]
MRAIGGVSARCSKPRDTSRGAGAGQIGGRSGQPVGRPSRRAWLR